MWMTTAGLVLDILGVVWVFFIGFPQPEFNTSRYAITDHNTPPQEELDAQRRRRAWRAYGGLVLLLAGFVLQIAGNLSVQSAAAAGGIA
jgi:hypothetical protein